jgi:hypothetical protein
MRDHRAQGPNEFVKKQQTNSKGFPKIGNGLAGRGMGPKAQALEIKRLINGSSTPGVAAVTMVRWL